MTFGLDTDFFASCWVRGKRPVVVRWLICSLDDDDNFSVSHTLQRFMRGSIEPITDESASQRGKFIYTISLNFEETLDNGTTSNYLGRDTINTLLAKRPAIPCKVVMTIYLAKPYYSKTMYVPVNVLLDEVNKRGK